MWTCCQEDFIKNRHLFQRETSTVWESVSLIRLMNGWNTDCGQVWQQDGTWACPSDPFLLLWSVWRSRWRPAGPGGPAEEDARGSQSELRQPEGGVRPLQTAARRLRHRPLHLWTGPQRKLHPEGVHGETGPQQVRRTGPRVLPEIWSDWLQPVQWSSSICSVCFSPLGEDVDADIQQVCDACLLIPSRVCGVRPPRRLFISSRIRCIWSEQADLLEKRRMWFLRFGQFVSGLWCPTETWSVI